MLCLFFSLLLLSPHRQDLLARLPACFLGRRKNVQPVVKQLIHLRRYKYQNFTLWRCLCWEVLISLIMFSFLEFESCVSTNFVSVLYSRSCVSTNFSAVILCTVEYSCNSVHFLVVLESRLVFKWLHSINIQTRILFWTISLSNEKRVCCCRRMNNNIVSRSGW